MIAGRKGSNRVEWEANWFAASLLMPEDVFKTAVNEGLSDMHLVARFNVSMEAAQVRKKVLNF
jgi:Zn-dependent peptidase ImmA (M78 family)